MSLGGNSVISHDVSDKFEISMTLYFITHISHYLWIQPSYMIYASDPL